MSHRLSLSRYWLATQCSYWARPDLRWEEKPSGEAARIGTLVHRLAELRGRRVAEEEGDLTLIQADPSELAEARKFLAGPLGAWVDAWRDAPVPSAFELRLRFDAAADGAREVPRRGEPGYSRPGPYEVTGEFDFVHNHGDSVDLVDLKTGAEKNVHEEQVLSYGLLASRFWRVDRVRVAFLFARKTKLTQTPWIELDRDRLDAEAGRLRKTLRLLPSAEPKAGDYCEWKCPMGRGACPAWVTQSADELEAAGFFA